MSGPLSCTLIVERESTGIRIDSFLIRHFRNYTPWRMQRIVRAGGATINDMPATQTDRVFRGQAITVRLLEPPDKLLRPQAISVPVLYADPWMVVVDKPVGMVAHPTGDFQETTLANAIQHWLDQRAPLRGLLRPGIVHRLDRETSGVMVVALNHLSHRRLAGMFEAGRVSKSYLAIVEGRVERDSGRIDLPIGRHPQGRHVLMSARADALQARPARTRYEVLQRWDDCTLVRAIPATGRNHQIRVHFAHIGHPLVADAFYLARGEVRPEHREHEHGDTRADLPLQRHALHAESLSLAHPITGMWHTFTARLPADMAAFLNQQGPPLQQPHLQQPRIHSSGTGFQPVTPFVEG